MAWALRRCEGALVVVVEPFRIQNKVGELSVLLRIVRSFTSKFCAAASLETIAAANSKSEFVIFPFGFWKDTNSFWTSGVKGILQTMGAQFSSL